MERWGNFGVLRRGGGGLVAGEGRGGEGSRAERGRRREDTLRVERASCSGALQLQGRWIARSSRFDHRIGRFELRQPSDLGLFLWLVSSSFRSGKAYGYELHDGDWIMGNQL